MTDFDSVAPFTLHGAMRRSAARYPDGRAVSDVSGTFTYRELDEHSGRIAGVLRRLGVEPGDRVALWAEKSAIAVATLYGILRCGAAYVPVDPTGPIVRGMSIVADAGCTVVCTDRPAAVEAVRSIPIVPRILGMATSIADADASWDEDELVAADRGTEADLAYVLYTSGSTGTPKGVMLTHRNALSFVEWAVDRFGVGCDDRLANHAPLHFDLSTFDVFAAALTGAEVCLLSPDETAFGSGMVDALKRHGVTVWYSTPSALMLLTDAARPEDLERVRVVLFAGEVYPPKHLHALRAIAPSAILANLYGPTETNVCTYHVVEDDISDDPIPIGRACENQEVFALTDELELTPIGAIGELWVRGPTVMKGYLGDPERTAAVLTQNPLHDRFPDPTYRTGDLVRRLPGEVFAFVGRRDHQIKSRGYRIELGEIEAVVSRHPSVREGAVVAVPDDRLGNKLIAAVVVTETTDPLALKRHCATHLPRYMIPGTIVFVPALPRTSTGKVDRHALASDFGGAPR